MNDDSRDDNQTLFDQFFSVLKGLPWLDMVVGAWQVVRQLVQGQRNQGFCEVLEYESTLELKDALGKRATFHKREKIRYLQDNVIAYQDQAWGDGKILIGYRCSPGRPVDRYRSGHKTYLLISRREVKNKGGRR